MAIIRDGKPVYKAGRRSRLRLIIGTAGGDDMSNPPARVCDIAVPAGDDMYMQVRHGLSGC